MKGLLLDLPNLNRRKAIKLLTAHLYENREAVTSLGVNTIPYTIGAMLQPYRILRQQSILGG